MPGPQQTHLFGGVCPLGNITVPAAGTPVPVTINLANQIQGSGVTSQDPLGRPFNGSCRQLIFSTPGNSGVIYVNYGNWPGLDAYATMLVIAPNQIASLPQGCLTEAAIDITQIFIDSASDGDSVVVVAVDGS
jgi:hypothetical protein